MAYLKAEMTVGERAEWTAESKAEMKAARDSKKVETKAGLGLKKVEKKAGRDTRRVEKKVEYSVDSKALTRVELMAD